MLNSHLRARSRTQRGLTLVEMMVGLAVGMFIVAGASMLTASQLAENRRLLLETQVQQDLRAALDIITRELRRAGYDTYPEAMVWSPGPAASQPSPNAKAGLLPLSVGDVVTYRYDRPSAAGVTNLGYQLGSGGIQQRIGTAIGAVQDLTDRTTLNVTAFTVIPQNVGSVQLACPQLCADGTQDCWPTLALTDAIVSITGNPVSDATIVRTVTSRVRLRSDGVQFNVSATRVCP